MKTSFLGPEGTFTQEALASLSEDPGELVSVQTVRDCVIAVQSKDTERAFVPIENSLEGSVTATLDALAFDAPDVRIIREVTHPIKHFLIARHNLKLDQIERIISLPHAKAQCSKFIREHLSGADLVAANSTADAVRIVSQSSERWAAVGTELSASIYSCNILKKNIEDSTNNQTRFVLLEHESEKTEIVENGSWKTSIVCGIGSDHPGALKEILDQFANRNINLTKIESRPAKTSLGAYVFFIDTEGRESDPDIQSALSELESGLSNLRVLGSYPIAEIAS